MGRFKIRIHPSVLLGLSIALIALPFRWVIAWILAGLFHELFHVVALYYFGEKRIALEIRMYGAKILASSINGINAILAYLMGPFGGIILMSARRYIPTIATCAFLQSMYNLLPIYPLDGGCIVLAILEMSNNRGNTLRIMNGISCFITVVILCLAVIMKSKILLALFAILGFKMIKNRPCKQIDEIVQ